MSERTPFPRSMITSVKPTVTSDDGLVQQCFVVDNKHSGEYLAEGPYYTDLVREAVRSARRLIFSEVGVEFAARKLIERDIAALGAKDEVDGDERSRNALEEVRALETVDLMSIVVDVKMKALSQISNHSVPLIYLGREVIEGAARSAYRAMAPEADVEAQAQRSRHVLFLAVIIANHSQLAIRWTIERMRLSGRDVLGPKRQVQVSVPAPPSPKVTSFVQRLRAVQYTKPVPGQPQLSDSEQRIKRGADGWMWETAFFGGVVVRVVDRSERSESSFSPSYAGLVVMKRKGGVEGHVKMSDRTIQEIVTGCEGWDKSLSLRIEQESVRGWVTGGALGSVYRALDGTPYNRYSASESSRYLDTEIIPSSSSKAAAISSSLSLAS